MKRIGIVSYNMYGNFTNYGSALQSYALHKTIDSIAPGGDRVGHSQLLSRCAA